VVANTKPFWLMQHFFSLVDVQLHGVWLTIGSFDGVHLGHQVIINKLTAEAHSDDSLAVVLTFFPHPATVVREHDFSFYLTTPEEKAELMESLGVDILITHPFDKKIASTPAKEFMKLLHQHLGMKYLQVGYDFALGRNREGNVSKLAEYGQELGYTIEATEAFKLNNQIVSSSRIRFLLGVGQVEEAAKLLNRNYSINGTVILGDQRGHKIGFPTANLDIWKMRTIPAAGVYACLAKVKDMTLGAVANIGVRPTFENSPGPPRVEAHLLDFQGDIYGDSIKLEFIKRLRDEQRFSSVVDLVHQIDRDVQATRQILA
jgi:riboflavin kinase/FMN adenylyltransferase